MTTYSHIFNIRSHLDNAKTLIFDDAHAAEGYVAEAWALEIKRLASLYNDLFDAFGPAIEEHLVTRMTGEGQDTSRWHEVRMIPMSAISQRISDLDSVLDVGIQSGTSGRYRFNMTRANLESCLFYVSRSGWYIRPMVPPTFEHAAFTHPEQRIYLSATLGEAGELERAFGRAPIARIPSPPAWERTGSGRRFFIFPDLAEFDAAVDTVATPPSDPNQLPGLAEQPSLLSRLSALAKKRLILTQKSEAAKEIAAHLDVPHAERFDASDTTVEAFKQAERGILLAASRYDGMCTGARTTRFHGRRPSDAPGMPYRDATCHPGFE